MDRKLIVTAAGAAIVAGGIGLVVGQSGTDAVPSTEQTEPGVNRPAKPAASETLVMTADRIKSAEIVLHTVSDTPFGSEIVAQGSVVAPPSGLAVLTAGADGRVTRITKQLGDAVARGESIATIESREAAGISADVASARSRARLAKSKYDRERRLFDAKVTARADLEAARADYEAANAEVARAGGSASAAGVSGRFIAVRSPIPGRVTEAPVVLGSYVSAKDELFRIANSSVVQVEASVTVADAARVVPGAKAVIENASDEVSATVRSVTPSASADSRTVTVVLTPSSGGSTLRAGQFVRARIVASGASSDSGITVPAEAVQSVGGRDVVFVRTDKGFRVQPVQLGTRTSDAAQILGGLEPSAIIAGKNAFLLKAELEKGSGEEE